MRAENLSGLGDLNPKDLEPDKPDGLGDLRKIKLNFF